MATRASKTQTDAARELAIQAARIAHDDNAEDVLVLDLRGISPVTDYFVIASGTSDRQLRAICDEMVAHGKACGQKVWHVEGKNSGEWILLDFFDVVVHLFEQSRRVYYDLELIWGEAPRVDWQR